MARTSTSAAGGDTPRRAGARAKRGQVIDAAVEMFLKNGYDQTSMESIAARAGVSKTTVYAHYPDKLALFKAVVERMAKTLALAPDEAATHPAASAETRLTQLILSVLEATVQPDFRSFLRIMVSESARHPDLAEAMRASQPVDVPALIAELLDEAAAERGYRLADSRAHAALLLRMVAAGPQLDSLVFAEFKPARDLLEAHARWIVTLFLRGIEPRAGETVAEALPLPGYARPWLPDDETATRG
ncbi:TetR/AcrR family transcriptional regulator [Streptomyces mangrovisoli]|uniref:HTH tetR-type domain-containing protein n=1 Tax=Streptomyces mangrovisoli TaxID=1428628 RepID=A0A1J4NUU0_9ACTN|nr:TetR/AcrR family transcriptional regulator [Streptomyces mangrovisoli]OIJ65005.1 hypothetical protein WN71_025725 [Streptomyces mangrovisoli]